MLYHLGSHEEAPGLVMKKKKGEEVWVSTDCGLFGKKQLRRGKQA